ncbi:hypothetical protein CBR_g4383 [Chara braunii]|uniref:Uncharacterized protein n=1 Tax=Chara braunii TaxID=69332 RepID=A0A388KHM7_CHABU|nr:hypothetical protein CBR_g4383 [Chara braunii]|eukprot:GBG69549.1 hypothetical protein CBR_g4383 [Chara braunii]
MLIQHQHNLPADLLEEGEELFSGWEKELRENLPFQPLGAIEKAQVTAELGGCIEVLGKVKGILVELWEGLHGVGPEEGQVLRVSQDCLYEADDACIPAAFLIEEVAICCEKPEEGQGSSGELEERSFVGDEDCPRLEGGVIAMCEKHNNNNNNNNNDNVFNFSDIDDGFTLFVAQGDADFMCNNDNNNSTDKSDVNNDDDNIRMDENDDNSDCASVVFTGRNNNIRYDDNNCDNNNNNSIVAGSMIGNVIDCIDYHCNNSIDKDKTVGDNTYDKGQDNWHVLSPFLHLSFSLCWSFLRVDQGSRREGWVMGRFGEQEDCAAKREVGWWRVGVG